MTVASAWDELRSEQGVVRHTFHQRLPVRTMRKPLLQIIRRTLSLQFKRLRLQCPIY